MASLVKRSNRSGTQSNKKLSFEGLEGRRLMAADLGNAGDVMADMDSAPSYTQTLDGSRFEAIAHTVSELTGNHSGVNSEGRVSVRPRQGLSSDIGEASSMLTHGRVDAASPMMPRSLPRQGVSSDIGEASSMLTHGRVDAASPLLMQTRHLASGGMTGVDASDSDAACLMTVQPPGTAELNDRVLTVVGTSGIDVISVTRDGSDWIKVQINGANDYFEYDNVDEIVIYGLCGDDVISVGEEPGSPGIDESALVTIVGGKGDDVIQGSNGDDVIFGGQGDDVIYGNGGDDVIHGGRGDDELHGGDGHDDIFGDEGNDKLWGDAGWDSLYGGAGDDGMFGGSGWDFIDSGTDSGNPAQGDYGDPDTIVLTEAPWVVFPLFE